MSPNHSITTQLLGLAMEAAVVLSIGHRALGSFVIAGVRVLYIKFNHLLVEVGVNRFVTVAKWTSFLLVLTITLGHVVETYFFRNKFKLKSRTGLASLPVYVRSNKQQQTAEAAGA